jgi:hypothetical protein
MAIVFIGFFRHATAMAFGEAPNDIKAGEGNVWLVLPPLALIAAALYVSIHLPPFLLTLLHDAAAHY